MADSEQEKLESMGLHKSDMKYYGLTRLHHQIYIFLIIAVIFMIVVVFRIVYGALIVKTKSMNDAAIVCNESNGDRGLCELINGYQDSGDVWHYRWRVVNNCNFKMPCNNGDIFDIQEYGEETLYYIGKVYTCYTNSDCSELSMNDQSNVIQYKVISVYILVVFMYLML